MKTKEELENNIEHIFKNIERIHGKSEAIDWIKLASHESASFILNQFESSEKEEFHVWIIPERKEILLEDRGGGIPVGATEHIVFDIWDGALKLCHFLEKTIGYTLEIDNEAGRWQSLN